MDVMITQRPARRERAEAAVAEIEQLMAEWEQVESEIAAG